MRGEITLGTGHWLLLEFFIMSLLIPKFIQGLQDAAKQLHQVNVSRLIRRTEGNFDYITLQSGEVLNVGMVDAREIEFDTIKVLIQKYSEIWPEKKRHEGLQHFAKLFGIDQTKIAALDRIDALSQDDLYKLYDGMVKYFNLTPLQILVYGFELKLFKKYKQ